MYKWGYLKEAILAKLDLDEEEAEIQGLISRFPIYANEVITQVCSAIKPKRDFAEFVVEEKDIGKAFTMPDDFVSFGDDVNTRTWVETWLCHDTYVEEAHDDDFRYLGYNKIMFKKPGTYHISYNARWIDFSRLGSDGLIDESIDLDVPADILDAIPSYVAHQCFKIDNDYKSSVFRNEYEIFLARIDDTDFKNTKTFKIGGDW